MLLLQGKCGGEVTTNMVNCAPCHHPGIDPTIDATLARPDKAHKCEVCLETDDEAQMLLCDSCGQGYHMKCLKPPLTEIPKGSWHCEDCASAQAITQATTQTGTLPAEDTAATEPDLPRRLAQRASRGRTTRYTPPAAGDEAGEGERALTTAQRDERAEKMDGMRVLIEEVDKDGNSKMGTVRFIGIKDRPRYFEIHFDDGAVRKDLTYTTLKRRSTLSDTVLLAGEATVGLSLSMDEASPALPRVPTLANQPNTVRSLLQALIPGEWTAEHAERTSQFVPGGALENKAVQDRWAGSLVTTRDVAPLLQLLDLRGIIGVVDPWAYGDGVKEAFAEHGLPVVTNLPESAGHRADVRMDCLMPANMEELRRRMPMDVVISSPWFVLLDLALPLAVLSARSLVCMRVPGHFKLRAPPPRRSWMDRLHAERRLIWVKNPPLSAVKQPCMWMLVFKDELTRRRMMKVHAHSGLGEDVIGL